ncbi:4-hydroxy-tetrahydrodipicolinate reductase [Actinomyces oricola]
MSIRVAVVGAAGRMGATVCRAVEAAEGLDLVARLDIGDAIDAEHLAGAEVAVDFTVPAVTEANVHALIEAGCDVVVGTTGWDEDSYGRVREHLARPEAAGRAVLIAPNFALSAVLAMSFAAKAARFFESAEVIELHHPGKVDAPSGTAVAPDQGIAAGRGAAGPCSLTAPTPNPPPHPPPGRGDSPWGTVGTTARGIAAARAQVGLAPGPDATQTDPHGSRGAVIDGVHVHAVRLRGLTAHEEILLGNPGEQLTIRTDSFDRSSFMPGVILAVRQVGRRQGLTVGLDALLDL